MTKINHLINSKLLKTSVLIFSSIVSLILIIKNNSVIFNCKADNSDNFFQAFQDFRQLGWYNGCAAGYGLLYNSFANFFFGITNSVEKSFFLVNLFSQILILEILIKTLLFFKNKLDKFYFYAIAILTITQIINLKSYYGAYNDTFLAIFISAIIYLITTKLLYEFTNKRNFLLLGILFAIALSIRESTLVIILATILIIIFLKFSEKISWTIIGKNMVYLLIPFLLLTAILHYPSLKENGKLCFYDKNPKTGANWTQRNYLGLKKIQNRELPANRDAIWKQTKFAVVNDYLIINGANSLPRNLFQVITKDPLLLLEISVYNIIYLLLYSFRFYGILLFFFIYLALKKPLLKKENVMLFATLFIYLFWSFVCFTFVETRWLTGYEFLIPAIFFSYFDNKSSKFSTINMNYVVALSLLIVSLLNIKSILH